MDIHVTERAVYLDSRRRGECTAQEATSGIHGAMLAELGKWCPCTTPYPSGERGSASGSGVGQSLFEIAKQCKQSLGSEGQLRVPVLAQ